MNTLYSNYTFTDPFLMKILVAGTPGTGKSTICKMLAESYNLPYIDISKYIISNKLYTEYNPEYDTYEFDTRKIRKALKAELKEDFIIETHTPEVVKKINFDHVFVMRTDNEILYKRLKEREYNDKKITENIDCEIFNEIGYDCEEFFRKVNYIENNTTIEDAYKKVVEVLK